MSAILLGALMLGTTTVRAASYIKDSNKAPIVHWAVVESVPGKMGELQALGGKYVGPEIAKESGTYLLYGALDKNNNNINRILEIYKDQAAYEIHAHSEGFKQYCQVRKPILKDVKILEATPIALEQKTVGLGKAVYLRLLVIKPEQMKACEQLVKREMARAVDEEANVLGMFATAEKNRPNVVHGMEIFTDETAYTKYTASKEYKKFRAALAPMLISEHLVENMPANINLSVKGL